MKKCAKKLLIMFLAVLTMGLLPVSTCFAGDVPEGLLCNENALVFFGEVQAIDTDKIVVTVTENIKGNAEAADEYTYAEWAFTQDLVVGEVYLCGYYDENNPLYIWEITEQNAETLKIKNTDDMSKRMEQYLNNGDFAEAQAKLMEKQGVDKTTDAIKAPENKPASEDATSNGIIGGADGPTTIFVAGGFEKGATFGVAAGAVILVGILVFIRKKFK